MDRSWLNQQQAWFSHKRSLTIVMSAVAGLAYRCQPAFCPISIGNPPQARRENKRAEGGAPDEIIEAVKNGENNQQVGEITSGGALNLADPSMGFIPRYAQCT